MYCPSCGTQNKEDVRFCRKCGADLRVVSQAVTRRVSLRHILATRIDGYVEAKRRGEVENTGLAAITLGSLLLVAGIYNMIFFRDVVQAMIIINALGVITIGIRDRWVYKRSLSYEYHPDPEDIQRFSDKPDLSIYKPDEPPPRKQVAGPTKNVEDTPTDLLPGAAPPSVTEQTTQLLEAGVNESNDRS